MYKDRFFFMLFPIFTHCDDSIDALLTLTVVSLPGDSLAYCPLPGAAHSQTQVPSRAPL